MPETTLRRSLFALLAVLVAAPAFGAPLSSDDASPCGGDAYSHAEVVEGRRPRRGPLTAMPDTLCADVSAPPGQTRIDIYGVPGVSAGGGYEGGGGYDAGGPGRDGLGGGGDYAPYGERPPRRPRRGD